MRMVVKCQMLQPCQWQSRLGNPTPESVIGTTVKITVDRFTYQQIT